MEIPSTQVRAAETGSVWPGWGQDGTVSHCPGYCNTTVISEPKSLGIVCGRMQLKPRTTAVLGWTGISLLPTLSAYIFWQTSVSVFYLPAPSVKTLRLSIWLPGLWCSSERCQREVLPRELEKAFEGISAQQLNHGGYWGAHGSQFIFLS